MVAVLGDDFAEKVQRVVRQVLREERQPGGPSAKYPKRVLPWQWAIANEAIAAATNGLTDPGTGTVEFLDMDENQDLSRSGVTYPGVNRSESVSIEADTLLIVARFKGERIIIWADCVALASPPS